MLILFVSFIDSIKMLQVLDLNLHKFHISVVKRITYINVLIQLIKLSPKPNFFKMHHKKPFSNKKHFKIHMHQKNLPQVSVISNISLLLSLLSLFFTYAIWSEETTEGKIGLRFTEEALDNMFVSRLTNKIGLHFFMYVLSLSFFLKQL